MQFHQLNPRQKFKKRKRVGRGGKRGTYSGRGNKGQKARAGRKLRPLIRELIKRYPKLRGYRLKKREKKLAIINIGILEKKFESSKIISPQSLLKKRIIRKIKGRLPQVKILGGGETKKRFVIKDCQLSKDAQEKIKKAGGKILSGRR